LVRIRGNVGDTSHGSRGNACNFGSGVAKVSDRTGAAQAVSVSIIVPRGTWRGRIVCKWGTEVASTNRLKRTAHHEAGHAVMHLMFGRYIESISIITDHRRGHNGICKTSGLVRPTREADLLCKMAGPVAGILWQGSELSRKAIFSQMWDEGVFDVKPEITTGSYYGHIALCFEVMAEPDFRNAVNLLASRLLKHKYLGGDRVIRFKDDVLWSIYDTSKERVRHAKKTPERIVTQIATKHRNAKHETLN
jgi:hypothetical protein